MINLLSSIDNPNAELVIQYKHNQRYIDKFSSKMYNINIEDGTDCRKNYEFPNGRIKDKVVITISSKHKNDLTTKKWSW